MRAGSTEPARIVAGELFRSVTVKAVSGRQYHWSILKLTLKMFLWFFIFNVLWKFVNLQPDDFEGILRDLDLIFVEEDSLLNDGKIEKSFNSHATNWF